MQLQHDFTIEQPIDRVWSVLTDLRNVAVALPGASIEDVESDGTHNGTLRLKLGSFVAHFRGAARYVEVDPVARRVIMTGEGSSAQGRAGVRLEGRAEEVGPSATRVTLESQLDLNGRIAQFGAAMAGDVARQVLDQFVANLAKLFDPTVDGRPAAPAAAAAAAAGQSSAPDPATRPSVLHDDVLDVGSMLVPPALRQPAVLGTVIAALLLGWLLGHRRSPTLRLDASTWRALTDVR